MNLATKGDREKANEGSISVGIRAIDKLGLRRHYRKFSVRANSPQHELLVFGDLDSNEKRSISTIAQRVIRPGTNNDILNIFCRGCCKVRWSSVALRSRDFLGLRSKHFKSLFNDGVMQIPLDRAGVVHIWYETCEGIDIEELRRDKT